MLRTLCILTGFGDTNDNHPSRLLVVGATEIELQQGYLRFLGLDGSLPQVFFMFGN